MPTPSLPKGGLHPPHPLQGEWLVFLIIGATIINYKIIAFPYRDKFYKTSFPWGRLG